MKPIVSMIDLPPRSGGMKRHLRGPLERRARPTILRFGSGMRGDVITPAGCLPVVALPIRNDNDPPMGLDLR